MRKERETANELAKRAGKALKDVRSISAITGKAWFLSPFACTVILLICSGIDLCGFMSLTKTITNELHKLKQSSHFLIPYMAVAGLLAAFEVAPVYMGYALCLKLQGLGKGESGERVWK